MRKIHRRIKSRVRTAGAERNVIDPDGGGGVLNTGSEADAWRVYRIDRLSINANKKRERQRESESGNRFRLPALNN